MAGGFRPASLHKVSFEIKNAAGFGPAASQRGIKE
jgi:hypothetical protein